MERYVHIAAGSMRINVDNQRLIASSLANQNTTAFKRDLSSTASVYVNQDPLSDRVFPARGKATVDLEPGKLISTTTQWMLRLRVMVFLLAENPMELLSSHEEAIFILAQIEPCVMGKI